MILGLSIGSVHNLVKSDNRDDYLTYIRELNLDINAIELVWDKSTLKKLSISEENMKWINNLNHLSYHLNPRIVAWFMTLRKVDYYIWHYDLEPFKADTQTKSKTLIENLDKSQLNYFGLYSHNYNICCDISHALSYGFKFLEDFLEIYHRKIKQFHLSNYDKECHVPFYSARSDNLERIKALLEKYNLLNLPFIMEYNFKTELDLLNEFTYIKNILWEK